MAKSKKADAASGGADETTLPDPERLGPYVIRERLGSGGMGAVYRAHDERLDRTVAIKYIRAQDYDSVDLRERFQREARAAAQLNHPSIVQIFDFVQEEECDWIVMEHAGGRTLNDVLRTDGRLDLAHALPLLRDLAHGLADAHRHGVVHRDVKTENVIITEIGRVKILDFGVARRILADHPQDRTLTLDGMIIGTPHAMSPEQVNGKGVDHRTDIFSFGTLCYEVLTGERPFKAANPIKSLYLVCTQEPPGVHEVNPRVPEEVGSLVERMMAKDPGERPADMREVARELDRLVGLEISGYFTLGLAARKAPASAPPELLPPAAGPPERRRVTLLLGEATGELAEDPETLFTARPPLHRFAEGVLKRFGGRLLEYRDDGFLACFGYPAASEDDARRAVATARELALRIPAQGLGELRFGVHTGMVVVGRRRGANRDELALAGAARRVAELARRAGPGDVVLDGETRGLVRPFFESEPAGDVEGGVRGYRLTAERPAEKIDGGPLVGRAGELEILRMAWRWVGMGRGQVVWLVGEAGVGKSRLVRSFLEESAIEPLFAQARPETRKIPLAPLAEILSGHLGAGVTTAGLESFLDGLGLPAEDLVPVLTSLLGLGLEEPRERLDSTAKRREAVQALLAVLVEMARQKPLMVWLDDLRRTDAITRELLDHLVRQTARLPLLLVLTSRPGFEGRWSGPHVSLVTLHPLSRAETEEILDRVAAGGGLGEAARERILDMSAGIARLAEDLTRTWIETAPEDVAAGCPGPVPPTLYGALRARLDELEPELRELAALGALLGPLFSWELVAATSESDPEELRSRLDALVEEGVLERPGEREPSTFVFRTPLLRDVAYASLLTASRRGLHARVAELLTHRFASLGEERPEVLAWHRRASAPP